MQKISKYSVVIQRILPLLRLAAHKHFNTGAAFRSAVNVKLGSGTVLGCHEAVVRTISYISPEKAEESFFLFSSGEWEAGCDTSSPLDMAGR